MKLSDQVRFVRQNAKKNKGRLAMTMLATAMGCAFLITLASVGFGLQKSIVEDIVGDRLVTSIEVWGKEREGDRALTEEDMAYLRAAEHVKSVTFRHVLAQAPKVRVNGEEPSAVGDVVAVDFAEEAKAGLALHAGRLPSAPDELLVGYHLAGEDPAASIGRTLELEVTQFRDGELARMPAAGTIVGVKKAPSKEWHQDYSIYIGLDLLERIEQATGTQLGAVLHPDLPKEALAAVPTPEQPRTYRSVEAIADSAAHVKGIAETLRAAGYYNHSIANELEQVNVVFLIMKIGLAFVGAIAVLIASIGIYNTMTMAVTERAADIGIMKAVGAHPSIIRRLFLLESGWIGAIGAAAGAAAAYAISAAVNAALPVVIERFMETSLPEGFLFSFIPPYLTALCCLLSLVVAVLSGAGPAARATRVDVLRALRREV